MENDILETTIRKLFLKFVSARNITEEESTFFRHVVKSWLEFALKTYISCETSKLHTIHSPSLLVGFIDENRRLCGDAKRLGYEQCETDEDLANVWLKENLPFVCRKNGWYPGSKSVLLLNISSYTVKVCLSVTRFLEEIRDAWKSYVCLQLFVVGLQASGLLPCKVVDLIRGTHNASETWMITVVGSHRDLLDALTLMRIAPRPSTSVCRYKNIWTESKREKTYKQISADQGRTRTRVHKVVIDKKQ